MICKKIISILSKYNSSREIDFIGKEIYRSSKNLYFIIIEMIINIWYDGKIVKDFSLLLSELYKDLQPLIS